VSRRGDNFGLTNTVFSVVWPTGVFASYLRRILAFADSSWADDKNDRRVLWLTICSSTMRPFHGVLPSLADYCFKHY